MRHAGYVGGCLDEPSSLLLASHHGVNTALTVFGADEHARLLVWYVTAALRHRQHYAFVHGDTSLLRATLRRQNTG